MSANPSGFSDILGAPPDIAAEILASYIVTEVSELSDRTSPPDQPSMMLVTPEELRDIITMIAAPVFAALFNGPADALTRLDAWHSIEIAPRDGSEILMAFGCGFDAPPPLVVGWCSRRQVWMLVGPEIELLTVPTHWRPLPEPPIEMGGAAPMQGQAVMPDATAPAEPANPEAGTPAPRASTIRARARK